MTFSSKESRYLADFRNLCLNDVARRHPLTQAIEYSSFLFPLWKEAFSEGELDEWAHAMKVVTRMISVYKVGYTPQRREWDISHKEANDERVGL